MTSLDELRDGGRLVATGSFDLDPARAREKLARYQLVDPHRYVLQFVQAAQLLGATQIHASIDADEFEMSFDGDSASAAELGEIYLHAFGHRGIQKLAALRHLALGVIAAEAVDPTVIRLSGSGGTLTVKGGDEVVDAERTTPGNEVYVRERARLRHVIEFFRTIRGRTAEEVALDDACYAKPDLVVNKRRRNNREPPPRDAVKIDGPHEFGWVAVTGSNRRLALVQHGVIVEQLALSIGGLVVTGVIETARLSTNLSQSAFVRNHMWDAVIQTVVMPAVLEATEARLSRQLRGQNRLHVEAMIAEALRCREDFARRGEPTLRFDSLVMRWADVPVWRRLATQADGRTRVSTQELFNVIGDGAVCKSSIVEDLDMLRWRGVEVEHVLVSRRRHEVLRPEQLASATDRKLVDLTEEVREASRQRVAGQRLVGDFAGLVRGAVGLQIDPNSWGHVQHVASSDLRVELAVPAVPLRRSMAVVVVVDGAVRLRTDVQLPVLAGCGVLVAQDATTDLPPTELIRAATPSLIEAAVALLTARDIPRVVRTNVLHALASEQLAAQVMTALGWGVAPGDELQKVATVAANEVFGTASADAAMFEQVGSRRVLSICEVGKSLPVRFVPEASRRRALQLAWEIELIGSEPPVWLDEREQAILKWLFGPDALEDVEAELQQAAARIQRGRTGFVEEPVLHGLFVSKRALGGPTLRGEVGLASATSASSFIELVVLHDGKRLAHRELPCLDGQFRAIVEADELRPTEDLADVVEDAAYADVAARIVSVCHEMFDAWCLQQLGRSERDESTNLALWRAVANASPDHDRHRLDWPVFETTEGALSAAKLRQRVGDGGVTVAAQATSGFAVFVPVAPTEHMPLLAKIVPSTRITRARRTSAAAAVAGKLPHAADGSAVVHDADPIVIGLRRCGFDVERIERIVDSALEPRLHDRLLSFGAQHPLAQSRVSPALIAAIGVIVAKSSIECAAALTILRTTA